MAPLTHTHSRRFEFTDWPTRHLFFTGKGGVGKTTSPARTAIALADAGQRVLLVSTDPASNLDEVLGSQLGRRADPVPGVSGPVRRSTSIRKRLPLPIASGWSGRIAAFCRRPPSPAWKSSSPAPAPWRSLPSTSSPSCSAIPRRRADFDHVIFDTAPTGHTLRLLTCRPPGAASSRTNRAAPPASGRSPACRPSSGLYLRTVRLADRPADDALVLVAAPIRRPFGSRAHQRRTSRHWECKSAPGYQWGLSAQRNRPAGGGPRCSAEPAGAIPDALAAIAAPRCRLALRVYWAPSAAGDRGWRGEPRADLLGLHSQNWTGAAWT